jgi:hypothetical protein
VNLVARFGYVLLEYQDAAEAWQPVGQDLTLRQVLQQYRVVRRTSVSARGKRQRAYWHDGQRVRQ